MNAVSPGDAPPPSDAPSRVEILPPADAPSPRVRQLWRRRSIAKWCTGVSLLGIVQLGVMGALPSANRGPWYAVAWVVVGLGFVASVTVWNVTSFAITRLGAQERIPQQIQAVGSALGTLVPMVLLPVIVLGFMASLVSVAQIWWPPLVFLALGVLVAGSWYAVETRRDRKYGDLRHHVPLTAAHLIRTHNIVPEVRLTFADGKRVVYLGNAYFRRVLRARMAQERLPIPEWLAPELDADPPRLNRYGWIKEI